MNTLAADALSIWKAGVAAVDSRRLVREAISLQGDTLEICGQRWSLSDFDRVVVIGAGKAGRGMAAGVEAAFGPEFTAKFVEGWINVPADCSAPLSKIHLHAARPAGLNEPTEAGVLGTEAILELARNVTNRDLCLVLLSGGGSALLPAPIPGITLEDKQAVTRFLMTSGASIHQLNTVRKRLSRIKGGGLGRLLAGKAAIALIISDVIGDPLEIIASGPTVADPTTAADALAILRHFATDESAIPARVWQALYAAVQTESNDVEITMPNYLIGTNRTALADAADYARSLGYAVEILGSDRQGIAREVGWEWGRLARQRLRERSGDAPPLCLLAGGEPVVKLVETSQPRRGGRNQEVALAAADFLWDVPSTELDRLVVLSGGTDGEDGPTDAAGAWFDRTVRDEGLRRQISPAADLAINNAYHFFETCGGLIKTGPTHTNVMDLQVVLVGREPRVKS